MRIPATVALCLASLIAPAGAQSFTQPGTGTPSANPGVSYQDPTQPAPSPSVPQALRYDIPGAVTPAAGNLSGTAQRDSSACCGSGAAAASVAAVAPTGSHTGSPTGSGTAPDSYFCLTQHNGWPLNAASPNQCKFKSTELKMAQCTCGAYSYYDTYYVNMPGFGQTNSYDIAVNYNCRGYDYVQTVYYTCNGYDTCSYQQGYCY